MLINLDRQFSRFLPYTIIDGIPIRRRIRRPKVSRKFKKSDTTPLKVIRTTSNRRVKNIK